MSGGASEREAERMSEPEMWPPNHEELREWQRKNDIGVAAVVLLFVLAIVCLEIWA